MLPDWFLIALIAFNAFVCGFTLRGLLDRKGRSSER